MSIFREEETFKTRTFHNNGNYIKVWDRLDDVTAVDNTYSPYRIQDTIRGVIMKEILFTGFSPSAKGKDIYISDGEEIRGDWKFGFYASVIRRCSSMHASGAFYNIHYIMVPEERDNGETYLVDYEVLPETVSQL